MNLDLFVCGGGGGGGFSRTKRTPLAMFLKSQQTVLVYTVHVVNNIHRSEWAE